MEPASGWKSPGRPTIATELDVDGGRIATLAFTPGRFRGTASCVWPQQLRVTLGYADRAEQVVVPLDGARAVEARDAVGRPAPLYVLPNGGGWAYGAFVLDPDVARLPVGVAAGASPIR